MNLLVAIAETAMIAVRAITATVMIDVTAMIVGTVTTAIAISLVAAEQSLPNQNFLLDVNR